MHLGPLGLAPQFRISAGFANNILNDPLDPKEDWLTTIAPSTRAALRIGRARLEGHAGLSAEQYRHYRNESSANVTANAALGVSLNRLLPFAEHSFVHSRERQGIEIDTRPLRRQRSTTVGVDVRVGSKLTFGVSGTQGKTRYDAEEQFRGTSLSQALDRDVETGTVSVRRPISALTTLDLSADWSRDQFLGSPERNAESVRYGAALTFKSTALVSGGFNLAYLRFMPSNSAVAAFRGPVTSANLAYILLGVTRIGVSVDRHVDYSYDPGSPYFVITGATVSLTQRAGEQWAIWGSAGRYGMEYLETAPALDAAAVESPTVAPQLNRPADVSDQFVAGISRFFSRGIELAISAERMFRHSSLPTREYQDTRAKVTLAHRF